MANFGASERLLLTMTLASNRLGRREVPLMRRSLLQCLLDRQRPMTAEDFQWDSQVGYSRLTCIRSNESPFPYSPFAPPLPSQRQ
jgi:hypothetical protein